jgi:hypothetical protein
VGGIAFVNPAMFLGALLLALPLVIHLLTRRTPVLVTFPTLRFLVQATANQSRLFRVRHYLLMLIRTLVILLLLAAFLRPYLTEGTLAATTQPDGGTAAIVIVDASLSMGYAGRGISPFARAVSAAEAILGDLGPNDLANVVYAGAQPHAVFDEPSPNRAQLRSGLADYRPTQSRADLDAAIALALEQLDAHAGRNREIHFLSDFQRTNWAAVDFAAIPETVKTVLVSTAEDNPSNLAITSIRLRPASPAVGESVELVCSVANYGAEARRVPMSLRLGEDEAQERILQVDPGMTATASVRAQFDRSGIIEGTASIGEDALGADNTRYVVVQVSERFPIVVLTTATPADRGASSRFLAAALDPFADGSSAFVPELMPPDAFDRFAAGRAHAVLVSQASDLHMDTARLLAAYLKDGGRVLYFVESPEDINNLALLREQSGGDIRLPFTPLGLEGVDGTAYATLVSANYDDPMLKKFRETSALADLHFFRYFATQREEAQGQVLLKYDNGHIALASTTFGLGTLLLANFSPSLEGSDLQKSTVFVPLLHEMVKAMGLEGGGNRDFPAGYPCSMSITLPAADTPVRFTDPLDEEVSATVDLNGAAGAVFFNDTATTGFYRVYNGDAVAGSVAVNTDARESNLESLTAAQLEEMARRSQETFYASTGADAGTLRRLREGVPLWHFFLAAALAFLAIEQGFAWVWRR